MSEPLTVVVSRTRSGPTSHRMLEDELIEKLTRRAGLRVWVVPHLYDLVPTSRVWELLRSVDGPLLVLGWLYPRAAFWVLDANGISGQMGATGTFPQQQAASQSRAGAPAGQRTIWCVDLRAYRQADSVMGEVESLHQEAVALGVGQCDLPAVVEEITEATTARWYPVLDYSRCNGCMECLNFCLFGVYGLGAEDPLVVEQPDACRDGCPACARICPEGAVMFPEHDDPAIAGDPMASRDGFALDLSQMFVVRGPAELAALERHRALREQGQQQGDSSPTGEVSDGSSGTTPDPTRPAGSQSQPESADEPAANDSQGQPPEKPRSSSDPLDRLVDELDQWDM